eukprot:CAMPEP_0115840916 /NCGR_PEP_ID=MMETSP0287-20121206/7018_1 /TAXON_ID=412157 /ORGANISM="Chrysochromulina rotalis, Strain UIO044" /LENGTH=77 /DNA_ID=CAMNT_0003294543 /DNA_START=303 /DNA_END=536 /DNA_ORIENTATION=-
MDQRLCERPMRLDQASEARSEHESKDQAEQMEGDQRHEHCSASLRSAVGKAGAQQWQAKHDGLLRGAEGKRYALGQL